MIRILFFVVLALNCIGCVKKDSIVEAATDEYATVNIGIPFNAIKVECPDLSSSQHITFAYTLSDCFSSDKFCDFGRIEYLINNEVIETHFFEELDATVVPNRFNIKYLGLNTLNLDKYKVSNELCFSMNIYSECWIGAPNVFTTTSCVPVVTEGQEYTVKEQANAVNPFELECLEEKMLILCCNESKSKSMMIETISTIPKDSISRLIINDEFVNLSSIPDVVSPLSYVIKISPKPATFSSGESIDLLGVEGKCTSLRPIIYFRKVNQNNYIASPCGVEDVLQESTLIGENVFQIGFERCNLSDCNKDKRE